MVPEVNPLEGRPHRHMSMLKYPLYEFIATVPNCVETTTVGDVLEIFQQQECTRLAILDKQKCLLGLIYSARLLPQLLTAGQGEGRSQFFDLQQPLSTLDQGLIEPIQTIPASFNVEQFSSFLRFQKTEANTNLDWALIDLDGKFLGLVDTSLLLGFLREQKSATETSKGTRRRNSKKTLHKSSGNPLSYYTEASKTKDANGRAYAHEQKQECEPLVHSLGH